MLPYLVIGAGIGLVCLSWLSKSENAARAKYCRENDDLAREMRQRQQDIMTLTSNIDGVQDFSRCMAMYTASIKTADACYENYSALKNMLAACFQNKNNFGNLIGVLKKERDSLLQSQNKERLIQINVELKQIREFFAQTKAEIIHLKERKDQLFEQLKALNQKTRAFKLFIRDNCGRGGMIWYTRKHG